MKKLKKVLLPITIGASFLPYYLQGSNYNTADFTSATKPPTIQSFTQNQPSLEQMVNENSGGVNSHIEPTKSEYSIKPTKPFKNYRIIEDEEFFPFKVIGYVGSIPTKVLLLSTKVNNYVTPEVKKRIEHVLENDSKIDGLTVRLNHTSPFKDTYRLFTEKQLRERNNFFVRLLIGAPDTLITEFLAKFTRSDYYNPYTKTAVLFSDVEAIAEHEIGHHRDFTRFKRDWIYSMARYFPPVMLYQEWKASKYAKQVLHDDNKSQYWRYLMPAFGTYILVSIGSAIKFLRRLKGDGD